MTDKRSNMIVFMSNDIVASLFKKSFSPQHKLATLLVQIETLVKLFLSLSLYI